MKYLTISAVIFITAYFAAQSGTLTEVFGYTLSVVIISLLGLNLLLSSLWKVLNPAIKKHIIEWFVIELDENNENF